MLRTLFICTAVSRSNVPALRKHVLLVFAVTCCREFVSGDSTSPVGFQRNLGWFQKEGQRQQLRSRFHGSKVRCFHGRFTTTHAC